MIKRDYFVLADAMRIFFICVMVFLLMNFLPYFWIGENAYRGVFPWITGLLASLSLLASVYIYSNSSKIDFVKATRLDVKPDGRRVFAALAVTVGLILLMLPVVDLYTEFLIKIGYKPSGLSPQNIAETIIFVVAACIVAPVTEEIFMRGAVAGGFSSMGKVGASLMSGFLFMIFHMSPESTLHQFVLGAVLGYMYLTSGSVWVPILTHFFNNIISVALALFLPEVWYRIIFHNYVWATLAVGAVLTAAGLLLFAKSRPDNFKTFAERRKPKVFDEFGFGEIAAANPPRAAARDRFLFWIAEWFAASSIILNEPIDRYRQRWFNGLK